MAVFVNYVLLFLLKSSLLTFIVVKGASDSSTCDSGSFFDVTENRCKKCSTCPSTGVVKRNCSAFADLKCVKSPRAADTEFKFNSNRLRATSNSNSLKIKKKERSRVNERQNKNKPSSLNNELSSVDEDKYWKTLAFALIGLLSVLIITTFVILIFVYKKLQKSIVIKQTEEGDLMDDADSGYVVIRTIHHMAHPRLDSNNPILSLYSREQTATESNPPLLMSSSSGPTSIDSGRPADSLSTSTQMHADNNDSDSKTCFLPKTYQPQRRLLAYDADDVFESDDNNVSNSHLADQKLKLQNLIDENNS